MEIVKSYKRKTPQLVIKQIKKKDFDHGNTRNLAVQVAKGHYICFFSQDIDILDTDVLTYFQEDFKLDKRVVSVFGKQIPYTNTPVMQRLDIISAYDRLDSYTNSQGLLIQDRYNVYIPLDSKNKPQWFFLSDAFVCYKKDFLQQYPFPKTMYGEDLRMGETIINQGFIKIYDKRALVKHSHFHNVKEHSSRLQEDIKLRYKDTIFIMPANYFHKLKIIVSSDSKVIRKIKHTILLNIDYFMKLLLLIKIKLFG